MDITKTNRIKYLRNMAEKFEIGFASKNHCL